MIDSVDPFIGTEATDLAEVGGLAASWWWPKPQVGNTHPGATSPFGMVSACAYSGAYPTGYGRYDLSTEGVPSRRFERLQASGFTHFQQSGTGAIRKYYNYLRVTPMLAPLDELGTAWDLLDEQAEPGWYAATLASGIRCEVTVGPKSAVHRYTFPADRDARLVIDLSQGGLAIDHGRTVPLRAGLHTAGPGVAQGEIVVEGVPLAVHIEHDTPGWRQMLWYDRRLMAGSSRLDFDAIRQTTLRPFGLVARGAIEAGGTIEVRLGFSLRGVDQARANLHADCGAGPRCFDERRAATRQAWSDHLKRLEVGGGAPERRTVYATAAYHSLIKPCFAPDESPFWTSSSAFAFDLSTMWDLYKTQLPLLIAVAPERAVELVSALLSVVEQEGNLPIGYRMARGSDRFFRQGSALAHTFLADVCGLTGACGLGADAIDWEWALVHMHDDLRRSYGEDYLERGLAHPISHTLDLADGYHCTARVARHVGDHRLAGQLDALASRWRGAFDPTTGLLVDSTFYEGGRWSYSFRLLHDLAARIDLAGGDEGFVALLDRFFGVGAPPVKQLGEAPSPDEVAAGYALDRFEGLNNEPDMEAPWAYHFAGRPDRTARVVHAARESMFGPGRGGLPGNDDSGGLSSWYVWASLGLFPVAGQSLFLLTPPAFAEARLGTVGEDLEVVARGHRAPSADRAHQVLVGARLDGVALDRAWLTAAEVHAGGRLELELADEPTGWGGAHRPPSGPTRPVPEGRGAHP